jgi:hypothetical protein
MRLVLEVVIRKLTISLWMLMFPEVVVAWAFRQWYQARNFAKRYEGRCQSMTAWYYLVDQSPFLLARGWTIAHGHLALMGGFMLFQAERPIQVLSPSKFNRLLLSGSVEFPSITNQDIKRRGKGRPLLAALTLLQSSWFIVQCIARRMRGLTITPMEMTTLALISMYALLLVAWWHKPLDVQDFIRLDLTHIPQPENVHLQGHIDGDFAREQKLGAQFEAVVNLGSPFMANGENPPLRVFNKLITLPGLVFKRTCDHYHQLSFPAGSKISEGSTEIPLFYSQPLSQPSIALSFCAMNTLGSLFAASHLLSASLPHFPSKGDQMRWIFSAVACTVLPILLVVIACVLIPIITLSITSWNRIPQILFKAVRVFIICVPILGFWTRLGPTLLLFIEAALCLRGLGANARVPIPWTNYIPHFH